MIEFIGYHGTEITRGNRFISNNSMEESIGDKHWLGNGSYFYEEMFYAYKWIKDMFCDKEKRSHKEYDELINKYIILTCNIRTKEERIFDLDKYEYKYLFDYFFEKLEKQKNYSKRFENHKIADGVVINIMFNEYGYKNKYDVVIASFSRRNNKYKNNPITRLKHVMEKQICVKNIKIVEDINKKDFSGEYVKLNMLVDSLDKEINLNKYSSRRRKKRNLF